MGKKEREETVAAMQAVEKEWKRLRDMVTWDEDSVREWREVAWTAKSKGEVAHVGRLIALCVQKGSELQDGDPEKKFKGRVVFGGDRVWDQNWDAAVFSELSASPAIMEAAKSVDVYGMLPGHVVMQSDARQAYTQARLLGPPTWVRLPKDQWPASWSAMHDPVCILRLALYGHPDAGGYWEKHCEAKIAEVGFTPLDEDGWATGDDDAWMGTPSGSNRHG